MNDYFKNKKILVAGGTGVIGLPLVRMLSEFGSKISVVSMHSKKFAKKFLPKNVKFYRSDLRNFKNCNKFTKKKDIVINLVGIKGSTGIGKSKVADFFYSMVLFQTHLMESSFRNKVKKFVFVSSICGYPQTKKKKDEKDFWNGLPKQNDMIPGIVKRLGEIQGQSFLDQNNWRGVRIIRPANVFGPHDDFNIKTGQVIPSLITKIFKKDKKIEVWGDGKAKRDFIFSEDVAKAIIRVLYSKNVNSQPLNFGSGKAVSIKFLVKKNT